MKQQLFNARLIKHANAMLGQKMTCHGHECYLQNNGRWYAYIPDDGRLEAQVAAGNFVELNLGHDQTAVVNTEAGAPTQPQSPATQTQDLNGMTVAELREMAKQMGIPNADNMKKVDLIQIIQSQPSY